MIFYRILSSLSNYFSRKIFSIITFSLLFISSLGLSATSCPQTFYTYQVGHTIQVIRNLETNIESIQDLLPLPPNGTVWVHRPLKSLQLVEHRHIKVDFRMTPIDSEDRASIILSFAQSGLVPIDRLNTNVYFFELRPIREVLASEIEVGSDLKEIRNLKDEELRHLSSEMIHLIWWNLTDKQISYLTTEHLNWRMSRRLPFAPPHKIWLTQKQVLGINKENIQNALDEFDIYRWWKWFSEEQISWLTEDQLRNLVLNIKKSNITEDLKGVTILGKIQLKLQMNQFSKKRISELTEDKLRDLILNLK